MPVDSIRRTIDRDLDPGTVVLTVPHQIHVQKSHPADYGRCLPHVAAILAYPLFIGDDFKNDGIELIARVSAIGSPMLVAVKIDLTEKGTYEVSSFYPISEKKIQNRLDKGFLKPAQNR